MLDCVLQSIAGTFRYLVASLLTEQALSSTIDSSYTPPAQYPEPGPDWCNIPASPLKQGWHFDYWGVAKW